MDGSNQNQNKQGANQTNNQKPGLSWTQPASTTVLQKNSPKVAAIEPADTTGRIVGIIVGIIVVFALAAWGIVALQKRAASHTAGTATSTDESALAETSAGDTPAAIDVDVSHPTTNTTVPTKTQVSADASASLTVPAVQSAGTSVAFENLSISAPTWVIVYESVNGTPGSILGAGLFFKGDTSGSVSLLRATVAGHEYLVSAAADNGDGRFAKGDEKYVPDATGAQMWIKFQTN